MEYGTFKSSFIITIGDVPETLANKVVKALDGVVMRTWGGLCDIQFRNHKMRVYDNRVTIRNPITHNYSTLYFNEFRSIDIR